MLGYEERTQRQRIARRSTRRWSGFSFAAVGSAIASASLIASVNHGLMAVNVSSAPPLALLTDVPSHNGAYSASMTPSSGAIRGNHSLTWTLDIRTAAGAPVESASLALEGWMPDNETAGVIRPRTPAGLGDGRYRVEGLRFDSRGWWNVRLRISAAGVTDSLAFNLVLDQ